MSTAVSHLRDHVDVYAAAVSALVAVFHLFLTPEYFAGSGTDMVSMEHPLHVFATSWMARGVLPLWNPFSLGGAPFQAGVHGYLYPGWWTGVFFPAGLDIKIGIALHLALAGAGGAYFARGRVKSRVASYLAGVTYALSGFAISHLFAGHRVLVATSAWLPWLAGWLDRACRSGRSLSLRPILGGAAIAGLAFLCGHYQALYIGLGGIAAFLLLDRLADAPDAQPSVRLAGAGRVFALIVAVVAGGAIVAAVQILPMVSTLGLSQRSSGGAEFAASFSSAWPNLLSYAWPDLFGNKVDAPFFGDWSYWESLGYLGLAPIVLLALALVILPWRRWIAALAVSALALVLSVGAHSPLFDLYVAAVPGADLFRSPGRFCLVPALLLPIVAAEGLDAWLDRERPATRAALALSVAALLPVAALAFWAWLGSLDTEEFSASIGALAGVSSPIDWSAALRLALSDARKASLVFAAVWIALALMRRPSFVRPAAVAIAAIALVDLLHFGHRFLTTAPEETFLWPDGVARVLRESEPGTRVIPAPELHAPNRPAVYDTGSIAGYDIFMDERYARYVNRAERRDLDRFISYINVRNYTRLHRHLGASLHLAAAPFASEKAAMMRGFERFVYHGRFGRIHVYRDQNPTPRVLLAHSIEVVPDEIAAYARMESASFDPRDTALVEAVLEPGPEPRLPGATENAHISVYEPNRVEIEVRAASRAVLVLSDVLHPGWSATVDGESAPLFHANRVMRGLLVPAGPHRVVMTYRPVSFVAGAAISVLALLGLVSTAVVIRRRTRRS